MRHNCINGWTKAKMLEVVEARPSKLPAFQNGQCVYLTGDGNKCGVGLFIPDGHEGQKHHGYVSSLLESHPDLSKIMPLEYTGLKEFQNCHDSVNLTCDAKAAMIEWIKENVTEE